MKSAYIIIAHGSRDEESNRDFLDLVAKFRRLHGKTAVEPAFLDLCRPSVSDALKAVMSQEVGEVYILPMMLFPGRHVKEDIPNLIQQAKMEHPSVDFHYAGPLSGQPMLLKLLQEQADSVTKKAVKTRV